MISETEMIAIYEYWCKPPYGEGEWEEEMDTGQTLTEAQRTIIKLWLELDRLKEEHDTLL